jgi:hypothetical protein
MNGVYTNPIKDKESQISQSEEYCLPSKATRNQHVRRLTMSESRHTEFWPEGATLPHQSQDGSSEDAATTWWRAYTHWSIPRRLLSATGTSVHCARDLIYSSVNWNISRDRKYKESAQMTCSTNPMSKPSLGTPLISIEINNSQKRPVWCYILFMGFCTFLSRVFSFYSTDSASGRRNKKVFRKLSV